ncbi:MarR family transcriptional regulator [Alcaligenaceae bacterium]|nr:MarR family transcriptional regulator [Alcaligenaceae bacterium]
MTSKTEESLLNELRPRLLRISQAMRRETKTLPITQSQSAVLSALMMGKPMRLTDLAKAEAVSLPTMNQVINRMMLSGWVRKTQQAETSVVLIEITEEGRSAAAQTAKLRNQTLHWRMQRLSPEEQALLPGFIAIIDRMFPREPWMFDPAAAGKKGGKARA